jgi:hypothetical protein
MPEDTNVKDAVLEIVSQSSEPCGAKQVQTRMAKPLRPPVDALPHLLEDLVVRGKVYRWPPTRKGGLPRYWVHDPRTLTRKRILEALADQALTSAEVGKALAKFKPRISAADRNHHLRVLVEEGKVFKHPKLGRTERLGLHPPDPKPYLEKVMAQFEAVCAKLATAGVSRADVAKAVLERAGEPARVKRPSEPEVTVGAIQPPAPTATSPAALGDRIFVKMIEIEPRARTGALVSLRNVRRAMSIGKEDFDAAVIDLANRGRIMLHQHDFPGGLTEQERAELVDDRKGHLYVGAVLAEAFAQ